MKIRILLLSSLLAVFAQLVFAAPPTLHLAIIPSIKALPPIQKRVLTAYQKLGFRVYLHEYDGDDSLKITDVGKLDGELVRSTAIENHSKHLIRIPVKLFEGDLVLICQQNLACNRDILNRTDKIIGAVKAPNIQTDYLKNINATANIYQVDHLELLHNLLKKQRINYIISIIDQQQQDTTGLDLSQFSYITLSHIEAYHYLHQSHQDLLPLITEALAKN